MFSTQLHVSWQTAASTIKDWPIFGATFYTGYISLTGLGFSCAFRCTSVDAAWLLDTWSISANQSPALTAADMCDLRQVPRVKMTTSGNCAFRTCRSIYLERSAENSQMQFTLFTYFQTSFKTFLFSFFLRESSYCCQCVLAIAILSVCLSVCHTGGSVKNGAI